MPAHRTLTGAHASIATIGFLVRRMLFLVALLLAFQPGIDSFLWAQEVRKYPNSEKGFQNLIEDALDAAKKNDQAGVLALTTTMLLPDSEKWFDKLFGNDYGASYAKKYLETSDKIQVELAGLLLGLAQSGYESMEVARLDGLCDPGTRQEEYSLLLTRKRHEPLSVVRFKYKDGTRSLRYFAYADGGYRYLGDLGLPKHSGPPKDSAVRAKDGTPSRIVTGGDVQMAKLIRRVQPEYPLAARRARIQGIVRLHTIISKDGRVSEVVVVSGPCELTQAAYNAVIQWTFKPTLLKPRDGSDPIPVEVECIFDVNFNMGSR